MSLSATARLARPFLLFLILFAFSATTEATIRYIVSLDHPEQHLFHVTMTIPDVKGEVIVQMAAWNALYQIRDFSAHIQQVEAFIGPDKAPIEKLDKQTWRIKARGAVTVRYATYLDEVGPFATQLNGEHAFINPAMILLYIPDHRAEDVVLTIPSPPENWRRALRAWRPRPQPRARGAREAWCWHYSGRHACWALPYDPGQAAADCWNTFLRL